MMTALLVYLLKTSLYLAAVYIQYALILRRTTFFTVNRIYLVFGLLSSFLLPLCSLPTSVTSSLPVSTLLFEPGAGIATPSVEVPVATQFVPDWQTFALIAYLAGIAIRTGMLARGLRQIIALHRAGTEQMVHGIRCITTHTQAPFTFFNRVYLPAGTLAPEIVDHETAHVSQQHWIDLLMVEVSALLLWFHPLMPLYRRAVKQQHEYLADRFVIDHGTSIASYLHALRHQIEHTISLSLTSEFYFQSIQKRIHMLTTRRTSAAMILAYTMAIPALAFMLMAFSPRPIPPSFQITDAAIVLTSPIKQPYQMESGFGERMHPVLHARRMHTGIDLIASEGTPVLAAQSGVVVKAQYADAWGNLIVIRHDDIYQTSYSHLKSMNVKQGDKVLQGQEIGLVGNTGLSSKFHLHFELHERNKAVDPVGYWEVGR